MAGGPLYLYLLLRLLLYLHLGVSTFKGSHPSGLLLAQNRVKVEVPGRVEPGSGWEPGSMAHGPPGQQNDPLSSTDKPKRAASRSLSPGALRGPRRYPVR